MGLLIIGFILIPDVPTSSGYQMNAHMWPDVVAAGRECSKCALGTVCHEIQDHVNT